MEYGIMRIEKRNRNDVYGLQIEANRSVTDHEQGREFHGSDIDWSRTKDNIYLIHTQNWNKEITRQIKEQGIKERKNSVVLLDGIYTASPEWFATHTKEEAMQFFKDCLEFHIKEYCSGNRDLLINGIIHGDETSYHLHVASLPITADGRLSAKIIMGNKNDYRKRQDKFFEEVSSKYGLDRGEIHDPAEVKKHINKREWQIMKQKQEIDNLEVEKELLDFDISAQRSKLNYEKNKAKQELENLSDKSNKMALENDKLQAMRNNTLEEQLTLINQNKALKKENEKLSNELNSIKNIILELREEYKKLKEFIGRNINTVCNWRDTATNKIAIADKKINEYIALSNEFERYQIKEIQRAAIEALGEVPDDGPDCDYDYDFSYGATQDTYANNSNYNSYDDEEWEL